MRSARVERQFERIRPDLDEVPNEGKWCCSIEAIITKTCHGTVEKQHVANLKHRVTHQQVGMLQQRAECTQAESPSRDSHQTARIGLMRTLAR